MKTIIKIKFDHIENPCLELGKKLNYPICCINSFMAGNHHANPKLDYAIKKASKGGFVPCLEHAKLLNMKKITLKQLIGVDPRSREIEYE